MSIESIVQRNNIIATAIVNELDVVLALYSKTDDADKVQLCADILALLIGALEVDDKTQLIRATATKDPRLMDLLNITYDRLKLKDMVIVENGEVANNDGRGFMFINTYLTSDIVNYLKSNINK